LTAIGVETGPEPRDSDGDGLTDGDELAGGTNQKAFSSDDDLLGDGFELANGLDPLNSDEDGNGVLDQHDDFDDDGPTNFQEMLYGTSTRRTDTDGDGLPDGRDTDGDGVSDGVEAVQGSDPTNPLDQGLAPDPEERIKLRLTVGDPSGSHSEQWALQVGAVTQESPDYGLVGSGEFSFDVGRSYPVTLRHRGSLYPDYPDYDWYADIEATDRSDFFVVDTNSPLYLIGPYQGDWMSQYVGDRFRSLAATLHVPRFDVDVDSNNDSGFLEPDDNREEDRLERDASRGKLVGVGAADRVPLAVRLSANVEEARPASTELYFDYDPTLFQLWKNAGPDRSPGNMIPAKTWVNAADIGLKPHNRGLVYVEALEGASAPVPLLTQTRITGLVGCWGGIHNEPTGILTDTVHLWPVEVDLDVDSDNDGGVQRSAAEDAIEDIADIDATPGLYLQVQDEDSDGDGLVNWADGFNGIGDELAVDDVSANATFAPLWFRIPEAVYAPDATLEIIYSASDPSAAVMDPHYLSWDRPTDGHLRIWTKDAFLPRNRHAVQDGGDYVAPTSRTARSYTLAELGLQPGDNQLFLEAIRESTTTAQQAITFRLTPRLAGKPAAFTIADTVRVTTARIEVLADNRDGTPAFPMFSLTATPMPNPKDRSANCTSASDGRAARTMRSTIRDWPGWMRRSLRGAEERHSSGNSSPTRAMSFAHAIRDVSCERGFA
jgi:hypothetical protein